MGEIISGDRDRGEAIQSLDLVVPEQPCQNRARFAQLKEGPVEVLRILRNILLRGFIIGAGITVLMGVLTIGFWDFSMSITNSLFHVDAERAAPLILYFFLVVRFVIWFCFLTPALALHWTLMAEAKRAR
jgi:hypothetical protein